MPVKARITPFEKSFQLLLEKNLSPEARSKRVAAFAATQIAAADAQNARALGSVPPKTVTVDGRQGAPLITVNPDRGYIIAEWSLVSDVLQWIKDTLYARSPHVSGDYRKSHVMSVESETEFLFYNPIAYSRRIEIGKTKTGRDFVIQVENRIYYRTYEDAKARFGNIAKISATFVPSNYSLKFDQKYRTFVGGARTYLRQRPDRVAGSAVTVPAIRVTLR